MLGVIKNGYFWLLLLLLFLLLALQSNKYNSNKRQKES